MRNNLKLSTLFEDIIGSADTRANIEIHIPIDSTHHSEERKFRHGASDEIENQEIIVTVQNASPKIVNDFLSANLALDQVIVIHNSKTSLNVVGKITQQAKAGLKFKVITVMRKDNFKTNDRLYRA